MRAPEAELESILGFDAERRGHSSPTTRGCGMCQSGPKRSHLGRTEGIYRAARETDCCWHLGRSLRSAFDRRDCLIRKDDNPI